MSPLLPKFLPYLRPYRWRFAWALVQVFLIAGFDLLKPWPLQLVIDHVLGGKPLTVAGLGFMVDVGNTDFWGITPVIVVTITISQYETNPSRIYA